MPMLERDWDTIPESHENAYTPNLGVPLSAAAKVPVQSDTLPSTVADSQDATNGDASVPQTTEEVGVIEGEGTGRAKMSSSDIEGEPTQEASSSILNGAIARSKSAIQDVEEQVRDTETQHTLEPGDEGHIDLLSSFIGPHEHFREDSPGDRDSEPIRSPHEPTQVSTPPAPTFKTPATAGRKRYSDGTLVDSPSLPRNPLIRGGAPTPARGLGLSQVFAGTQLGSSPFMNGFPLDLPSDRPSPSIELQTRPATAGLMTPLQQIEFRRATTEPASRYISLEESQARRERLEREKDMIELPLDEDDDDFNEPSSIIRQRLRQSDREKRLAIDIKNLSSPTRSSTYLVRGSKSSPLRSPRHLEQSVSPRVPRAQSPPKPLPSDEEANESEQETEQEDNQPESPSRGFSPVFDDEEDKENVIFPGLLVPRTTSKLHRVMLDSELSQTSPTNARTIRAEDIESGYEPGRVPNSQPSQSRHLITRHEPRPSSSAEAVDFVPQSITPPPDSSPPQVQVMVLEEEDDAVQAATGTRPVIDGDSEHQTLPEIAQQKSGSNTIPETSSDRLRGGGNTSSEQPSTSGQDRSTLTTDTAKFETAATHPPSSSASVPKISPLSSPPIPITPPGQRRKRKMADIADETSPRHGSQDVTTPFSAKRAIGFDGIADVLSRSSSPAKIRTYSRKTKRRRTSHSSMMASDVVEISTGRIQSETSPQVLNVPEQDPEMTASGKGVEDVSDGLREEAANEDEEPPVSSDIVTRSRRVRPRSIDSNRRKTTWDIDASSPKPAAPIIKLQPAQQQRQTASSRPATRGTKRLLEEPHEELPGTSEGLGLPNPASRDTRLSKKLCMSTKPLPKSSSGPIEDQLEAKYANNNQADITRTNLTSDTNSPAVTESRDDVFRSEPRTRKSVRSSSVVEDGAAQNKPKSKKSAHRGPSLGTNADQSQSTTTTTALPDTIVDRDGTGNEPGDIPESPDPLALPSLHPVIPAAHTNTDDVVAPNMVFAAYNGKSRAYYPAVCLGEVAGTPKRYQIQWDGFEPDVVDAYGICRLDLRVGDAVKIEMEGFPRVSHIIRGFKDKVDTASKSATDVRGFKTLLVAAKQRKSLPAKLAAETVQEVPVAAIYLDSNMWNQMKNRSYTFQAISTPNNTSGFSTPAPPASTPSTPSSRSKRQSKMDPVKDEPGNARTTDGLFSNMAFAISYDTTHADRKIPITNLILANGGTILPNSFEDLFDMSTTSPINSTTDLALPLKPQFADYAFTAHITDSYNRRAKYLQALALGVPCLSGRWVEACVNAGELLPWLDYLLPAGESQQLDNAVRNRYLSHAIATKNAKFLLLKDILEERSDILEGAELVVVQGRGQGVKERQETFSFLVRAMKAAKVQNAVDMDAAIKLLKVSPPPPGGIAEQRKRYLFVPDRNVETAKSQIKNVKLRGVEVIGNEFIAQSLILGRSYTQD